MRGKFASWQQTLQLPRGMGLKMPAHEVAQFRTSNFELGGGLGEFLIWP